VSVPVALEALHDRIGEYGRRAFLVTTDGEHPHVVSVVVDLDGDRLVVEAGRRSSANVRAHPTVTLVWPPAAADGDYGLIVDGEGQPADGEQGPLAVAPTAAVLHRMADAAGDGPSCIRILDA
jgi:hypothetical protein